MLTRLGGWFTSRLEAVLASATLVVLAVRASIERRKEGRRVVIGQAARQIVFTGYNAVPLISFLALLTGVVVVVLMATLFPRASSEEPISKALTYLIVRELGPLTTAVVVILRSCSAVTVELGYMRARGELEAMETLGIDPTKFVLLPRFAGITTAVIGLTIVFVVIAHLAGVVVGAALDLAPSAGWLLDRLSSNLRPADLIVALGKATVFGIIIAATACFHGLSVPRDLTQIPPRVTQALVGALTYCTIVSAIVTVLTA